MRTLRERIARKIAEPYLREHHTKWDTIIDTAQIRYEFQADDIIEMFNKELLNSKLGKALETSRQKGTIGMFTTQTENLCRTIEIRK